MAKFKSVLKHYFSEEVPNIAITCRAMQLRSDVAEVVYEQLILLNNEDDVRQDIKRLFEEKYEQKKVMS